MYCYTTRCAVTVQDVQLQCEMDCCNVRCTVALWHSVRLSCSVRCTLCEMHCYTMRCTVSVRCTVALWDTVTVKVYSYMLRCTLAVWDVVMCSVWTTIALRCTNTVRCTVTVWDYCCTVNCTFAVCHVHLWDVLLHSELYIYNVRLLLHYELYICSVLCTCVRCTITLW